MEKPINFKKQLASAIIFASCAMSTNVWANELTQEQDKSEVVKEDKQTSDNATAKSTASKDEAAISSSENNDDDVQTIEQWRAKRDKEKEHGTTYRFKRRDNDCWSFGRCNDRDGFHYAFSAISSNGDNFYSQTTESSDLNMYSSYRIQIAGFFIESPGLSTRRIHGLYADRSWGFNFYNTDQWRLDFYKNRDTRRTKDLQGIKARNKYKRAGVRLTGFFDSSQLQMDFSPYSTSDQSDDGLTASLSYSHYWQVKNWSFYGSAGMQFVGKEVVSFYESDPVSFDGRQDRVNRDVEVGFEYPLSKHWVIGGFAAYSHTDQPLPASTISELEHKGARSGLLLSFIL